MPLGPIIDPRTNRPIHAQQAAQETGVPADIIWYRFTSQGIRSMALFAPKGAEIDMERERQLTHELWRRSIVGIVSTHRLADIARAKRRIAA